MAAGAWKKVQQPPEAGRSYLICATFGGMQTCDVAFYNGRRPDGSHWWILGNVEIPQSAIDHYAALAFPE